MNSFLKGLMGLKNVLYAEAMAKMESEVMEKLIGENPMLNELKDLFKKEVGLLQTCKLTAMVINITNEFNADMLKDANSKDAAIDCIIAMLKSEKSGA